MKNIKTEPAQLAVGDKVKTTFFPHDAGVTRIVTRIERSANTKSGIRVWATDGGISPFCSNPRSRIVDGVDASWFVEIEKRVK